MLTLQEPTLSYKQKNYFHRQSFCKIYLEFTALGFTENIDLK